MVISVDGGDYPTASYSGSNMLQSRARPADAGPGPTPPAFTGVTEPLASSATLSGAGWIMVQIAVVPFVVVAGVAVLWWRHRDASGTACYALLSPCKQI